MGVVHVLTGPDHLSALATLSANVGNCQAFWYGVRWGVGHSIGLIVVGSIFIIISRSGDDGDDNHVIEIPEELESLCESFVGIFMLALGTYSLVKAYRIRRDGGLNHADEEEMKHSMMMMLDNGNDAGSYHSQHSVSTRSLANSAATRTKRHSFHKEPSDVSIMSISHQRVSSTGIHSSSSPKSLRPSIFQDEDEGAPLPFQLGEASLSLSDAPDSYSVRPMNIEQQRDHGHNHLPNMKDGFSKQFLSVCIGIVHGVAGPGGVLGVIPAVQLHNLWFSIVYLGSFCMTSTLVMGCYAAAYGICSSRLSRNSETFAFRMEVFSASLSIIVGCLWLTLLYLGILHDIFP